MRGCTEALGNLGTPGTDLAGAVRKDRKDNKILIEFFDTSRKVFLCFFLI